MGRRGIGRLAEAARAVRTMWAAVFACALGLGLFPAAAHAASGTADSSAVILGQLTIQNDQSMDFGNILPGVGGGTVTIPADTASPSCTSTGNALHTGACKPASFSGWGNSNQILNINLPNAPVTLTNQTPGSTATMDITVFSFNGDPNLQYVSGNASGNGAVRYRIVSGSGVYSFRVGGTLSVSATQAAGVYTGSFNVTVNYF